MDRHGLALDPTCYRPAVRVHHLDCLTLCPPSPRLVHGRGSWLGRGRLVCHVLLVETDAHGLVLVDTGIGLDDCRDPRGRLGGAFASMLGPGGAPETATATRQLEARGFRPGDVRHIVLTHLDLDHAGGLPDFPHATVHVMADEHAAAMAPTRAERARYRATQWAHGPRWSLHRAAGEAWRGFSAVRGLDGLPPELLLVPLSGHTRGHAAVAVETPAGPMLHCGDAYFHGACVDRTRGDVPLGMRLFEGLVAVDRRRVEENHARLRALAAGGDVRVFCAHDPEEFARAIDGR